ncbi:TetR/AcrR family transcriptional regulator [Umezawaea sp. Da 62-37]|uniref:TetR/AcrR family transcriptional regulator n=1 Tax=Umezawaea sp. Da 62-37 TaxID=3075927 RepID=UPI0028F7287B|nr:TetR/AcrR family transcriptional regulator [Umezawaea sp. Da 62-37]WNV87767.1 TetR/AcrR family transcriptional regulator [Umezawaea sp. Da 62-37]
MPKVVDHDERRADIVRAAWAVICRHGIEGATVRRVAEQAGVSMGGLRHYFDTQEGLLRFAALAVGGNISARVEARLRSDDAPADRARMVLEAMLPLDEERRVEATVWLAFMVRFRVDDTLRELRSTAWTGTRHICRVVVGLSRNVAAPEVIGDELPDADLEQWARHLHVVMDGLTLQAVSFPDRLSSEELRATVREQLGLVASTAHS